MKRILLAAAAVLGLGLGAVAINPPPASAGSGFSVGVTFGYPGYGYHRPYYPRYSLYRAPRHLVCYTTIRAKKVWRNHRVRFVRYPVRTCSWRYGW